MPLQGAARVSQVHFHEDFSLGSGVPGIGKLVEEDGHHLSVRTLHFVMHVMGVAFHLEHSTALKTRQLIPIQGVDILPGGSHLRGDHHDRGAHSQALQPGQGVFLDAAVPIVEGDHHWLGWSQFLSVEDRLQFIEIDGGVAVVLGEESLAPHQ